MLDTKGLTSSEASHIANFLKEQVKGIDITVENFKVITSQGKRDNDWLPIDTNKAVEDLKGSLLKKAEYFSLSAWLREAIKYKDNKINEAIAETFDNSNVEGLKPYPKAVATVDTSWSKFFEHLDIKAQSEYLTQEAIASHIGSFIHRFDVVRSKIDNYLPTDFVKLSNTETMTVKNTLLYDTDELLREVESLQSIHREAEKTINFYKAKHKEWVAIEERTYQILLAEHASETATVRVENTAILRKYQSDFEIQKTNKIEQLAQSKIVIPQSMQATLDNVYKKLK